MRLYEPYTDQKIAGSDLVAGKFPHLGDVSAADSATAAGSSNRNGMHRSQRST